MIRQDILRGEGSRIDKIEWSGREIYILRDDLIDPLISGNKWRKLKYILSGMEESGKDRLVTFGGAYSNHLVATAVAGHRAGLKTTGFLRGDEKRVWNAYETICIEHDMQLIPVSREEYRDKQALFNRYFGQDALSEFVGEGGEHDLAFKGCEELLEELNEIYDYIVLACGTGTTMRGIVKAVSERKLRTQVLGISVLKNNLEIDRMMEDFPSGYQKVFHDFHKGGYAKKDKELENFMALFFEQTGILTEFVYTAKMFLALKNLLKEGMIKKGKKILAIHTGGLPQLL